MRALKWNFKYKLTKIHHMNYCWICAHYYCYWCHKSDHFRGACRETRYWRKQMSDLHEMQRNLFPSSLALPGFISLKCIYFYENFTSKVEQIGSPNSHLGHKLLAQTKLKCNIKFTHALIHLINLIVSIWKASDRAPDKINYKYAPKRSLEGKLAGLNRTLKSEKLFRLLSLA